MSQEELKRILEEQARLRALENLQEGEVKEPVSEEEEEAMRIQAGIEPSLKKRRTGPLYLSDIVGGANQRFKNLKDNLYKNLSSQPEQNLNSTFEKMTNEEKSKIMDYLESYGTGARSGASTATFGLSEPIISGINAAVGNLISSGFDSKDAVDFIKNSINLERIGKEYDEDVKYRKKMQEEHPTADLVGSLFGGLSNLGSAGMVGRTVSGGLKKALPKLKPTLTNKTGIAAIEGALTFPTATTLEHNVKKTTGFAPDKDPVIKNYMDGTIYNKEEHNPINDALLGGTTKGALEAVKRLGVKGSAITALPFILKSGIEDYIDKDNQITLSKDQINAIQELKADMDRQDEDYRRWQELKKLLKKE